MSVTSIGGARPVLQALVGLVLMMPLPGLAGGAVEWQQWQDYDDPGPATAEQPVSRSVRGLRVGDRDGPRFRWDYQALRIRSGEPAHNGYLHRVALVSRETRGAWQLYLHAGLHGTSNILKYREPHSDVWVGRLGLWRDIPGGNGWALGVRGDHRFGRFRWVPALRGRIALGGGRLLVDLPRAIDWHGPSERWHLSVERLGDKWGALDESREQESTVRVEEWRLTLTRRFRDLYRGVGVELGGGASFDTRVRYREEDGSGVRQTLGDRPFLLVRLRW